MAMIMIPALNRYVLEATRATLRLPEIRFIEFENAITRVHAADPEMQAAPQVRAGFVP
jgi:hypothetical protein